MRRLLLLATMGVLAQPASAKWVASWGSAQQAAVSDNALPVTGTDVTLRQIVRLSLGGRSLRIRLSNAFGREPLTIANVHLARAAGKGGARVLDGTDRALTFGGRPGVTIPAGADYLSDPVTLDVPALASVAVSLHLAALPEAQTGHPGARATSYYLAGDHADAPDLPGAKTVEHWYWLTGVEVDTLDQVSAIVTLGDSITDGRGATTDGDDRWPDILANRLQSDARTRGLGVVNVGIGGNRLLLDGNGPNALARLDRDVLARPGVRTLVVLEGVNDLGTLTRDAPATPAEHRALVQRMITGYRQIVDRAHAQGVRVVGATIMPYMGMGYYHPDAANEADRQAINTWIRTGGAFDAVVDLDRVTRDPAHPTRLLPAYDSGDHIHPSPTGYHAMGQAIDVKVLLP
ncbi:SGNH/GDSL hydrolase family protein [uncultured Sphingomonas sp.]|uniref:SGNH/GDSL hydrolase family protein n=1 Tax=uncultured Sphingomonas sp. TaxID=158754 RepID=UPI0025F50CD2|nr:SGNH/GDSL hydrolase family protein [uncultured Sphingomonas sp.]